MQRFLFPRGHNKPSVLCFMLFEFLSNSSICFCYIIIDEYNPEKLQTESLSDTGKDLEIKTIQQISLISAETFEKSFGKERRTTLGD